jgi:hypothetical protein
MGRPFTILEDICRHALSVGADSIEIKHRDHHEWVAGRIGGKLVDFAKFPSSSLDARELRDTLDRVSKRPLRTVLSGHVYFLTSGVGEEAFVVRIEPAPKRDPNVAPRFTKTQGQYLAFIYNYMKIHGLAPSELDLQNYFRVSPPSVHEMIKTLERNSLIERTPGQARSIRLLVQPENLPRLI